MYFLPQSTWAKKQIPKKALFAKFDLKTSQRDAFDADVARIDIVAVVNENTLPAIGEGEKVKGFYVLAIQLKRKEYDTKSIALLNKLIQQNIVFALHFEDEVQFAINHTKLIKSAWQTESEASIPLSGISLDAVWENIVKSIGDIEVEEGKTLIEQIAADTQKAKILAQITSLEKKIANEKQPRKVRELYNEIKKLRNQL